MVDTYTTGKLGLIEPARGGYVDTWDEPLYANWQTLDAAVSGTTSITLSNSNVVLTVPTFPTNTNPPSVSTSCQNLRLYLTGTLAANLTIYIPATVGGFWIVDDATTGSYTVTVKTTAVGSTGVLSVQGSAIIIYSDGTNVKLADSGILDPKYLVRTGTVIQYAGNSPFPTGYLSCDGSAVSRTTYATLFAAIGTIWGSGDGLNTFNLPDLQNLFVRGASGTSGAGTSEAQSIQSHTHSATATDAGHTHTTPHANASPGVAGGGYVGGSSPYQDALNPTGTGFANISVTVASTGDAETRPANKRLWFLIKT